MVTAQIRVGPMVGASLLEHTDTSLTHGPLRDEVTLGRSWLLGAVLDAQLTEDDHLALEFTYGPYDHDMDRYCINSYSSLDGGWHWTCTTGDAVSRTSVYGVQYQRTFGRQSSRPFVGGGFGVKRYLVWAVRI